MGTYANLSGPSVDNAYAWGCYWAANLVAESLNTRKLAQPPPPSLLDTMRSARVGPLSFSSTLGEWGNNPVLEGDRSVELVETLNGESRQIGIVHTDGRVVLQSPPRWPGGVAPLACPKGTFGELQSGGWYECRFCASGTYAASEDSLRCETCPAGTSCPFGMSGPPFNQANFLPRSSNFLDILYPSPPSNSNTRWTVAQVAAPLCALNILLFLLMHTPLLPRSYTEFIREGFYRVDIIHSDKHYKSSFQLLSDYPTTIGGFLTVLAIICAVSAVMLTVLTVVLAPPRVESFSIPSTLEFLPPVKSVLRITVAAVGIDGDPTCDAFCSKSFDGEFAGGEAWTEIMCGVDTLINGCRTELQRETLELKSDFSVSFTVPWTRAFGWQWTISSEIDDQIISIHDNVTAPPDTVLFGPLQCTGIIGLQPTLLSKLEEDVFGFAPFTIQRNIGSSSHTPRAPLAGGISLALRFSVRSTLQVAREVSDVNGAITASILLASIAGVFRVASLLKYFVEGMQTFSSRASSKTCERLYQELSNHPDLQLRAPEPIGDEPIGHEL